MFYYQSHRNLKEVSKQNNNVVHLVINEKHMQKENRHKSSKLAQKFTLVGVFFNHWEITFQTLMNFQDLV